MRSCSIILFLASCARAVEVDYESMLGTLWNMTDVDNSGELSQAEFAKALDKIDVSPSIFTQHQRSASVFFTSIDTDSSQGLTPKELAKSVQTYSAYKDDLIKGFTNGAGSVPTTIPSVSSDVTASKATVTMKLSLAGKVSDIYPGQRKAIISWFADACGVTSTGVIVTFLPAPSDRRRRLQQASGGVLVAGTAFVADDASADAAIAALPSDASGFGSSTAFAGLTVTSARTMATKEFVIPFSSAGIAAGLMLALGLAMCLFASSVSKSKARTAGAQGGCCKAGCCSFYAVKPWAFGEFVAVCAVAATVIYLYTCMDALTATILGLIDTLIGLTASTIPAIQDLTSALPSAILDTISSYRDLVSLLPYAVMGPGALAIVTLLLGSFCPLLRSHKGSYSVTKCFLLLANLFLVLSFVFYAIFAAVSVVLKLGGPLIQTQISTITGMCDTIPPWISQLVADNQAAVNQLDAAGQDVTELQAQLDEVSNLSGLITGGCGYLNGLFDEFEKLFLPGVLCLVAIVFALFINNTLCCATGCCKGPPTTTASSSVKKREGMQVHANGSTTEPIQFGDDDRSLQNV